MISYKLPNTLFLGFTKSLGIKNQSDLDPAALREAFLFWMSKSVRETAARQGKGEMPTRCAQKILDTCVNTQNPKLVEHLVNNPGFSCNAGFDRLQAMYLEPLQGTFGQLRRSTQRRKLNLSDNEKLQLLFRASQVRMLAESLQADPGYPNIYSTICSKKFAQFGTAKTLPGRDQK